MSTLDGTVLAVSEKTVNTDSEYVRLIAPFEIKTAQSVKVEFVLDGAGLVYACAPQLENNPFANDYNMLENGNFELGTSYWNNSSGCYIDSKDRFNMSMSAHIVGDLNSARYCKQTVYPISTNSTRETFTLSGWAKGYGLPMRERNGSRIPTFRLRAVIRYSDYGTEEFTADFSPCTEDWQFTSIQFSKSKRKNVDYIYIYCDYDYNRENAYFDDIQLVRNSIEKGLTADDFVVNEDDGTSSVDSGATAGTNESQGFTEAIDTFGNALTETTFTDGEFGTIYRAFGYNADNNDDGDNTGNDLISETDAQGNTTQYTVNPDTSRTEEVTDRCGNKTAYEYDNAGRTTKVISKNSDGDVIAHVSYSYDTFDNMTKIARGDDMKYALAYNAFHNLESIGIDGKTEPLIKYTYKNGNGRLKEMTYANGDKMTATYNGVGQLVAEKWFNKNNVLVAHYKYVYDNSGNIVRSIDMMEEKEYNYIYDEGILIKAITYAIELDDENIVEKTVTDSIRYVYDSEGNMTKKIITTPNGETFTYSFESTDGNTVVTFSAGGRTVTSHSKTDSFGRKVFDELQLGTDFVSRQFVYHAGKITNEHKTNAKVKSSATTQLVSQIILSDGRAISYDYDDEERIIKVSDTFDGVVEYTYDALGQLKTESKNGVTTKFEYDNYGNITAKGVVDESGEIAEATKISYEYGNNTWKDLLTSYNGQNITYDAQGNPTTYRGHNLTWEK
ncbi:MAG: hypothetical protein E7612_08555, partial [Ruminococcaceae bacterium]|nr:hypothetical protein [Oscillospiraceae bacterium]